MFEWLWKWYGGSLGDSEETQSISVNSMSPIPEKKFINYARIRAEVDEDAEPYESIWTYQRMKRLNQKRIKEIMDEENIIDMNSNINSWFFGKKSMR